MDLQVTIKPFDRAVDRGGFHCGRRDLDEWLKFHAGQQERAHNTRTRLAVISGQEELAGYYSTTTYRLEADEAARATGVLSRRYPVPAILLARLAVAIRFAGLGIGRTLLQHAMSSIAAASEYVGFEVVVVHAIDDGAADFYRKYGFTSFLDQPHHLFLTTKTLLRTMDMA